MRAYQFVYILAEKKVTNLRTCVNAIRLSPS